MQQYGKPARAEREMVGVRDKDRAKIAGIDEKGKRQRGRPKIKL